MSCPDREDIVAYTREEWDAISLQTRGHIASCSSCQDECNDIANHFSLYQKLPSFHASANLWQDLRRKIEQESLPPEPVGDKPWYRKYPNIAAMVIVSLYLGWQFAARPPKNEGNVEFLHGMAQVSMDKIVTGGWEGKMVEGTTIDTLTDTTASFSLSKNISCHLGFDTRLVVHNSSLLSLDKGEAYLQVTPGHPLTVRVPQGDFQVLGTIFSISLGVEETILRVYEGTVRFSSTQGQQLVQKQQILRIANSIGKSVESFASTGRPWWIDIPFSLTLREAKTKNAVYLDIRNLTKNPLALQFLQGNTPHLLLKVENQNTSHSPFPLHESIAEKPIPPGDTISLKANISSFIEDPGKYTITVVYQGQIRSKSKWEGIISSNPITFVTNQQK